jgi:hypothetical protein
MQKSQGIKNQQPHAGHRHQCSHCRSGETQEKIDIVYEHELAEDEKRLKKLNDTIKEHAVAQFRDGDKKVEVKGSVYTWAISRSDSTTIDKDALKADGLLDKYSNPTTTYRLSVK